MMPYYFVVVYKQLQDLSSSVLIGESGFEVTVQRGFLLLNSTLLQAR